MCLYCFVIVAIFVFTAKKRYQPLILTSVKWVLSSKQAENPPPRKTEASGLVLTSVPIIFALTSIRVVLICGCISIQICISIYISNSCHHTVYRTLWPSLLQSRSFPPSTLTSPAIHLRWESKATSKDGLRMQSRQSSQQRDLARHVLMAFNPFQDKQNIDEPVASIHLDPLLVSKMTSICSNLKFASFQIGTEGHYRVSPLGPALDLFDSMNNAGMSSNMSVGSINNYNGYGHESAYAPPHTMNQVHQELDE